MVTVLAYQRTIAPAEFRRLAANPNAVVRTIALPLAGDTPFFVFSLNPFSRYPDASDWGTLQGVENAVRALEEFIMARFPAEQLTLLFASPTTPCNCVTSAPQIVGRFLGTHIIVDPDALWGSGRDSTRTLLHEEAHYYLYSRNLPVWFREGGADFLASYLSQNLSGRSLEFRLDVLSGTTGPMYRCISFKVDNIQALVDDVAAVGIQQHEQGPRFICNYSVGEVIFLAMYEAMGPVPFRKAFSEILSVAAVKEGPLTEEEIYKTFLRHTPAAKQPAFQKVYQVWHRGAFIQ